MLTKIRHIHGHTNIKRERVLPVAGQVLVRRMQKVGPADVVVVAALTPQFMLLDIAQGLNVSSAKADELLQREPGDDLVKGDVIAGPVGLFQRVVRATHPGQIRIAGEGKVLYEVSSPAFELQAGMEGTVTNIIPERGAIIETNGALIQGVWGNGKVTYGVIQPVSSDLLQELVPEQINIGFRGAIIIAGYCRNPDVLEAARGVPIKGLVLGSMEAELLPQARSMDYPILVVDGFGEKPMNRVAEAILSANKDKNVALNAQPYHPQKGEFPELIISLSSKTDSDVPEEAQSVKKGNKVIITNGPEVSSIGTIEAFYPGKYKLPNGIETHLAVVALPNEKRLAVPLTNLEIIL
jgi:hypothetical protein